MAQVEHDAFHRWSAGLATELVREVGGAPEGDVVRDVDDPASVQRREPALLVAPCEVWRLWPGGEALGNERVEEVGKGRAIGGGRNCLERDTSSLTARGDELELRLVRRDNHPEPVQHLGDQQELRDARGEAALVVAGDERLDKGADLVHRDSADRLHPRPDQIGAIDRVHDEEPVGELVQTHGKQAELAFVLGIERKDAAVPVALAEPGEQPHELDEPLVRLEPA